MTGYSGTPLQKKLGLRENLRVAAIEAPGDYTRLVGKLPAGVVVVEKPEGALDFIHLFARGRSELAARFPAAKAALKKDGMLWVSWPKREAKVATDLNENVVREVGLANGLVDVKVCAVDEVWSGLKFVYRLSDR